MKRMLIAAALCTAFGVASAYASLNLDKPYPNPVFTILIWGSDRPKCGEPEKKFKDTRICVTGRIEGYRGGAEIVARQATQIVVERE